MGIPKNAAYLVRFRNNKEAAAALCLLNGEGTIVIFGNDPGEFIVTEYQREILSRKRISYETLRISTLPKKQTVEINSPKKFKSYQEFQGSLRN